MNRSDLITAVATLAEQAEQGGEHAASAVLFAVVLGLSEGSDVELAAVVARWMAAGNPPGRVSAA